MIKAWISLGQFKLRQGCSTGSRAILAAVTVWARTGRGRPGAGTQIGTHSTCIITKLNYGISHGLNGFNGLKTVGGRRSKGTLKEANFHSLARSEGVCGIAKVLEDNSR